MRVIIITTRTVCAGTLSRVTRNLQGDSSPAGEPGFLFMELDYQKLGGLVPAVIQDFATREVLMVGFMNDEAFRKTRETGFATFYSRTRNKLWMKGETSGHRLAVKDILVDCDNDSLVVLAEAAGPGVCHEGYRSCFFRRVAEDGAVVFQEKTFTHPGGGQ
jgi:phosphoribosyl-AMP cyclohydrolase